MFRKKIFWIIVVVLVLAGGGYAAYTTWFAPKGGVETQAVIQTTTVTVGDMSITASGSGALVASTEVELAFDSSGTLMELLVEVGDHVQAGDILGWIDDTDARKEVASAEQALMEAEQTLSLAKAQAELNVAQAQADLETAQSALDDLLNWEADEEEIEMAKANVTSAESSYQTTAAKAKMWSDQIASTRISLAQAVQSLEDAQENYVDAMNTERDWEESIEDTRESAASSLVKAQQSLEVAQASYNLDTINTSTADLTSAWANVLSARSELEALETPPDEAEVTAAKAAVQQAEYTLQEAQLDLLDSGDGKIAAVREAELALEQAELTLEAAQKSLEGTTLIAPFDGIITTVNAEVGESVSGSVLVLANLNQPVVQFWVEETDMKSVAKGSPVNIVFEALPDFTYTGEVFRIDPVLVTVGSTPAVQAWATIDTGTHPVTLLGDMNAEVEVVSGEARNALLVPVQALREMEEDQYAVFVVLPNGELEMRQVEVGLIDFVNAEVKSGLQQGETVSLGESTSSSTTTEIDTGNPFEGGGMPGGGMPGGGMPPM
ncbi:MAG: efflux RND transporter periplasmic adaptor subunit [Anaerolineae bacterium]|nr:efflux RND transporter periplasmic adaptor subunit [Anaerolineae bacterium]